MWSLMIFNIEHQQNRFASSTSGDRSLVVSFSLSVSLALSGIWEMVFVASATLAVRLLWHYSKLHHCRIESRTEFITVFSSPSEKEYLSASQAFWSCWTVVPAHVLFATFGCCSILLADFSTDQDHFVKVELCLEQWRNDDFIIILAFYWILTSIKCRGDASFSYRKVPFAKKVKEERSNLAILPCMSMDSQKKSDYRRAFSSILAKCKLFINSELICFQRRLYSQSLNSVLSII